MPRSNKSKASETGIAKSAAGQARAISNTAKRTAASSPVVKKGVKRVARRARRVRGY